jgi:hypothetical protein
MFQNGTSKGSGVASVRENPRNLEENAWFCGTPLPLHPLAPRTFDHRRYPHRAAGRGDRARRFARDMPLSQSAYPSSLRLAAIARTSFAALQNRYFGVTMLLRTVAAMIAPCSVKTQGGFRRPPCPELEVTDCDFKSSIVISSRRSLGRVTPVIPNRRNRGGGRVGVSGGAR